MVQRAEQRGLLPPSSGPVGSLCAVGSLSRWGQEAWAVLMAADPGLLRLRLACRAAAAVLLVVAVEMVVGPAVGLPGIVAMLLGGMVAMNGSFATSSRPPRDAALTVAVFPAVAAVGVVAGGLVSGSRPLALVGFVVLMVAAVSVRRFGARWFTYGMLAWFAYFFTVFGAFRLAQVPGVLAVVAVATVCVILVTALVPDRPERMLAAAMSAFSVRIAALSSASRDALTGVLPGDRVVQTLHGRSFRVIEAALVIDGYLAIAGEAEQARASAVRHALLDAELVAEQLSGVAAYLALEPDVPPVARAALVAGLDAVHRGDDRRAGAEADRLAGAAQADTSEATRRRIGDAAGVVGRLVVVRDACAPRIPAHVTSYEPAVDMFLGNLPGTAPSATDALATGRSWWSRRSLNTRLCVQVAVAGSAAVAAGVALSPTRYYWAVLACFLTLTGTNTTGETIVKGASRVLGTAGGLVTATVAVHLTGRHDSAIIAVMVACVFLGLYFFRVSYAVMIFAVTTLLGELYNVLHEFSDQLLELRLAETAVGAAIGIAVALLILPLRTTDARAAAHRAFVGDLAALLADVRDRLALDAKTSNLLLDARRVDARLHQLALVARPSGGATLVGMGRRRATDELGLYTQTAYRARALAAAVAQLRPGRSPSLAADCDALRKRLDEGTSWSQPSSLPAGERAAADAVRGEADAVRGEADAVEPTVAKLVAGLAAAVSALPPVREDLPAA